MTTSPNTEQTNYRTVGDREVPLAVGLTRDGAVVSLTGKTVKFGMKSEDGTTKVAETAANVTVTNATQGHVQYDWQASDVDTAGVFYAFFVVIDDVTSRRDTYPPDGERLAVRFAPRVPEI